MRYDKCAGEKKGEKNGAGGQKRGVEGSGSALCEISKIARLISHKLQVTRRSDEIGFRAQMKRDKNREE